MLKNSAAPSPKSSPSCSARPRVLCPQKSLAPGADCIRSFMRTGLSRRRFLKSAVGLSAMAVPEIAAAQVGVRPPPKQPSPDQLSVAVPVSIEVNARPLPSFDTRDRGHLRFGSLEYPSGLILTSRFRGFGGLSGLRLDPKGERFIAISDKGTWFTGRIVYQGPEMMRVDAVEGGARLGPRC